MNIILLVVFSVSFLHNLGNTDILMLFLLTEICSFLISDSLETVHTVMIGYNNTIGKHLFTQAVDDLYGCIQGCQPVRNFRILYGICMQNTGVRIWPTKYGNWALLVLSHKVLLPEQSLPVLGCKSVKICGFLCLKTFKYLFNHQNIQSSLFHM